MSLDHLGRIQPSPECHQLFPTPVPLPCSPQVPLQGEIPVLLPVDHKPLKGRKKLHGMSFQSPSWIVVSILLWENRAGTNEMILSTRISAFGVTPGQGSKMGIPELEEPAQSLRWEKVTWPDQELGLEIPRHVCTGKRSLCPSSGPRRDSQPVPRCSVVPELGTSGIQVLTPSGAAWPRKPPGRAPELTPLDQPQ